MAKRTQKPSEGNTVKLNLPGVIVKDILPLEQFLPSLRISLAVVLVAAATVAQIRLRTASTMKPSEINQLDSVRTYNKRILAKSSEMLTVTTAVAIRRTMAASVNLTEEELSNEILDLVNNPTGESSTAESIRACINNPARLRKLRRGYMLQTVGTIQAAGVHTPTSFGPAIHTVTSDNILDALPFDTKDIKTSEIYDLVIRRLNPGDAEDFHIDFADAISLGSAKDNLVPLEEGLPITRSTDISLASLKIPAVSDKTPAWKLLAIEAAKKSFGRTQGEG